MSIVTPTRGVRLIEKSGLGIGNAAKKVHMRSYGGSSSDNATVAQLGKGSQASSWQKATRRKMFGRLVAQLTT